MEDRAVGLRDKIKATLYLFLLLIVMWLCLTSTFDWQELLSGIIISLLLAIFLNEFYRQLGFPPFTLRRFVFSIIYVAVLFKEIIKANLDVAYRVIHPKMPIKPGIVVIRTNLRQDVAKLILANSITLTPGTFTLDVLGENLLVHWINVKSDDVEEATAMIAGRFEKYLREIFK